MRLALEDSVARNSTISQDFSKKYYDLQVLSTLTFSFFLSFVLNFAIFNLQLLVS